jgi:DNA-binding XRE family transcriptional regulator
MGQLSQKPPTSVASRERLAERVIAFLRRKHPHKMPDAVAAETGVSAHTIRKMEERASAPSLAVFLALGHAYGPEFLHAVSGWRWLDAESRAEKLNQIEARKQRLEDELRALSP